jgi:plastocyanin
MNKRVLLSLCLFILLSGAGLAAYQQAADQTIEGGRGVGLAAAPPARAAAQEARELTVLAGAGQDTVSINAFFPASLRVRTGDTVTWKINSDEPHTASFLSGSAPPPEPIPIPDGGPTDLMSNPMLAFPSRAPDAPVETYSGTGYRNSGFLSNGTVVPPGETYSLTFDTPGTYEYICLIHPTTMKGEIVVEEASAADLPEQEEIDTMAEAEIAPLLEQAEELRAAAASSDIMVQQQPGPNGTTIWYIPAGVTGKDARIEIYDYFPKNLSIKEGDQVIWTSVFFHQVIFHPGLPAPPFVVPTPVEGEELPRLVISPEVAFPVVPAGEFDGTQLFSSGLMGTLGAPPPLPGGTTFALTFTKAGSYDYVCSTHQPLGMEGNITVVAP